MSTSFTKVRKRDKRVAQNQTSTKRVDWHRKHAQAKMLNQGETERSKGRSQGKL